MARRLIFIPMARGSIYVKEYEVDFNWDFGNSIKNTQESVRRMHKEALKRYKFKHLCEISGASIKPFERLLSAFQLPINIEGIVTTVECAYQGSKVFEHGGPYQDLYEVESRQSKKDPRLRNSGRITHFQLGSVEYSAEPKTAFYDMLYVGALQKFIGDAELSQRRFFKHFGHADGFTDIYSNPTKSINCQARSIALFIALHHRNLIDKNSYFQTYDILTGGKEQDEYFWKNTRRTG